MLRKTSSKLPSHSRRILSKQFTSPSTSKPPATPSVSPQTRISNAQNTAEKQTSSSKLLPAAIVLGGTVGGVLYLKANPTYTPSALENSTVVWPTIRKMIGTAQPPKSLSNSSQRAKAPELQVVDPAANVPEPQVVDPSSASTSEETAAAGDEEKELASVGVSAQEEAQALEMLNEEPIADDVVEKEATEVDPITLPTEESEVEAKVEGEAEENVSEDAIDKQVAMLENAPEQLENEQPEAEVAEADDSIAAEPEVAEEAAEVAAQPEATPFPEEMKEEAKHLQDTLVTELEQLYEEASASATASKERLAKDLKDETKALQQELETNLIAGLDKLTDAELRVRVIQLATELQSRTKWEALRLLESLNKVEREANEKSVDMLNKQAELHKEVMLRELRKQEEKISHEARTYVERFVKAMTEKAEKEKEDQRQQILNQAKAEMKSYKATVDEEVANTITDKVQAIELKHDEERGERMKELDELRLQIKALQGVLDSTSTYEAFSHQVHKVSVAALALSDKLDASAPMSLEMNALREAGRGDDLIEAVLASIPTALRNQGVPSVGQLEKRFEYVRTAGRRAALMPYEGMLGHIFGSVLAAVTLPPSGPIEGADAEAIFSRTAHNLQVGDLAGAVSELEQLEGYPREICSDWIQEAKSRMIMEQAASVIKAHVALLAVSCS